MLTRFTRLVVVGLLLEALAFAVWNRDVLRIRHQAHDATASAASRDDFARTAAEVLSRKTVTRDNLERVAREAYVLRLTAIEVQALDAAARQSPNDVKLRLRLADALRRAGDFSRAETLYQSVLDAPEGAEP
ncbi:MAG: tetratricopeptide repeat protein [Vicinamibacterales bacterium]